MQTQIFRSIAATFIAVASLSATAASSDIKDAWQGVSGELAKTALPGVGFSFKFNGKFIGPQLSDEWRETSASDGKAGITETVLTHSSGLVVTREMRKWRDSGAVEYQVRFKNSASKTLPPVSAIHSLNLAFKTSFGDGACVISSGGGMDDSFLPPRSFATRRNCFAPTVLHASAVDLTTEGGRSSSRDLPFFFVQNDARGEGLFVAFGWSGQWGTIVQRDPAAQTLTVRGRIPGLEIALEPGEEIVGPTVLIGLYKGGLEEGSNQLRRLVRDVYTPALGGKAFLPVATYDNFFGVGDRFDESLLRKLADGAAAIGQEYFLLDAGWYEGKSWFTSLGNWDGVEKSRLPNGLKPIADYVRSKGMQFGLWFEPERVAEGSQLAREHPDWVLWNHGTAATPWFGHVPWASDLNEDDGAEFFTKRFGLLDYGRPEVQQWVKELLDRYINDYDVKYIRYDFNIDPLPYWDLNDQRDRRGVTQLRHIQGLYAIIDWIRKRHPDTVLEACASGGRRIDLELTRRFHTFWISDYTVDPAIVRFHLFGISNFLPGNYNYVQYTLPVPNQEKFQPDDLGFQSMFGGSFGTGGRVDLWSEQMKQMAKQHVGVWKRLRRYLVGDFYALSEQPSDVKSWSGWQFQNREDHSGFIQTFRTQTDGATHRFVLRKLDDRSIYRFTDAYSKEVFEIAGSVAMRQGIEVRQEPMTSRVLTYEKVNGARLSER